MVSFHTTGSAKLAACMMAFGAMVVTACSSDRSDQSSSDRANPYHNGFAITRIANTEYSGLAPETETTNFAYDADRRAFVLSEEGADPGLVFSIDATGLVINSTDEGDTEPNTTVYGYDADGRLVSISSGGSLITARRYPAIAPAAIGPLEPLLLPDRIEEHALNGDIDVLDIRYENGVSGMATFAQDQNTTLFTLIESTETMLVLEITVGANDDVEVRIEYDYDDNGNPIAIREFDRDGTLDTETVIEYATAEPGVTNLSALLLSPFVDPLRFNIQSVTSTGDLPTISIE